MFSPRRLLLLALASAGLWLIAPAQAQTQTATDPASKYVQNLGDQALMVISDKNLSKDQKQAALEKIFSANVDFPWIGRFVMGVSWRQASEAQKTRYLKEYQKFLILHYTSRFTDYTSGSFRVTGARDDGDGEFAVATQMQSQEGDNSEPVLVDYRVRRQDKDGFKIFDVIVEGVSLITTQRSEFGSVIAKGGINYLIDQLAAKSQTGAVGTGEPKTK